MGTSDFYALPTRRERFTAEGGVMWGPVWTHDNEAFLSMHSASYAAVAAELPSDVIRPLRWTGDRTLVVVSAFRYRVVTWAGPDGTSGTLLPYAEVVVAAQVTEGPAPRVLPLLQGRTGMFVLQMPVTTRQGVHGGREFFGLPKFLADMDFTETGTSRSVQVTEGGQHLLTLTVHPGGRPRQATMNARLYSARKGELLRTVAPMWSVGQTRWGSNSATLQLGEHPVADRLRRLDISPSAISATSQLRHRTVMPMPEPGIGPSRDYPSYRGSDAGTARYTITYPYSPTIDQYEELRLVA